MSGTINVSRDLWDDPAFQNEPFSEREAWVWMISEASWKARDRRVGKVVVSLKRGQLAHSTRFLSDAWKWSHAKVRRFLDRLETRNMIRREPGTGVTVISIMKYDTYQNGGQSSGTVAAQQRHSSGTNEKKGERRGKEGEVREGSNEPLSADAAAPVHASEASEAVSAYNAAAEQAGWPKVQRMSPARTRALKARLRECGGIEGWQHALKRAIDSDFLCGRTPKAWAGFSFDWMIKAANFTKIMEGNYDNRDRQPANAESDPTLRAIARAARAF